MGTKQRVILALAAAAATALGTDAYADMINVPGDFGTIQAPIADPRTVAGAEIGVAPRSSTETTNFLVNATTLRRPDTPNRRNCPSSSRSNVTALLHKGQ